MADYTATIQHAGDDLFIGTNKHGNAVTVDTNSKNHSAPTPMELLLIAVGSCTAVDVVDILRKKRQEVSDYKIEISGERRIAHPRSFSTINVHHIVYGRNVSAQAVESAIKLSDEKYCSVAATVRPTATIITSYEIIESK